MPYHELKLWNSWHERMAREEQDEINRLKNLK